MTTTMEILDTVLLNLRIEDGKFLANLGVDVVEIDHLKRDGDGSVWVTYWQHGEQHTVRKYEARSSREMIKRVW